MKKCLVIYGAGEYGKRILNYFKCINEKREIVFCDSDKDLYGQVINGVEVKSLKDLRIKECEFYTGGRYVDDIVSILLRNKVSKGQIFVYKPDIVEVGTGGGKFYVPKEYFLENGKKKVYSIGIGEDISFDNEILKDDNVELFAFDPTPRAIEYINNSKIKGKSNFHFYKYGISGEDGIRDFYLPKNKEYVSASIILHNGVNRYDKLTVEMKRLDSVFSELNHNHINILKVDVEGAEFSIFDDYFKNNSGAQRFDYLCIELHERFFDEQMEIRNDFIQKMMDNGYCNWFSQGEEYLFVSSIKIQNSKLNPFKTLS